MGAEFRQDFSKRRLAERVIGDGDDQHRNPGKYVADHFIN